MKTFKKNFKKKRNLSRKTFKKQPKKNRRKLGAGPPDHYNDLSPLEQTEKVLDLVKKTEMNEVLTDDKTRRPMVINNITWSKLSYWNAYQTMFSEGNNDDMKNIVYMLKHDVHEHKKANKDTWKKHLSEAVFKNKYMEVFRDAPFNGPMIHQNKTTNIKMKDMIIILLKNRIEMLKWMEKTKADKQQSDERKEAQQKSAERKRAESKRAEIVIPKKNSTPDNWEQLS